MLANRFSGASSVTVLGMNSGTSANGLDLAVITFRSKGAEPRWTVRATRSVSFPKQLRKAILDLALTDQTSLEDLISADSALGQFSGVSAAKFVRDLHTKRIVIDAIASHGQTIRHFPTAPKKFGLCAHGTLQIGSTAHIAAETGLPVIGNFRAADVALGNEGAPITVAPVHRLLSSARESRLIVNIGGISNYFYFPFGRGVQHSHGGDCGPGNTLIDLLSEKLLGKPYDADGNQASRGEVSRRLLMLLLGQPFFRGKAISTGREEFGSKLAGQMIAFGKSHSLSPQDLLATAVELTALVIERSVRRWATHDSTCSSLIITGGGRKNRHLVRRLAMLCYPMSVQIIDDYGLDGDYVEAASYAALGESFLRGKPCWTVGIGRTGKRWPVLGQLALPPQVVSK